jgi:hypothetical protein
MGDLVTIATYDLPAKAEVERLVLEQEGIQTYLADDNMVRLDWFLSNAIGGAKLQVAEADAARAVEILEEHRSQVASLGADAPEVTFACQECGKSITLPGKRRGACRDLPALWQFR